MILRSRQSSRRYGSPFPLRSARRTPVQALPERIHRVLRRVRQREAAARRESRKEAAARLPPLREQTRQVRKNRQEQTRRECCRPEP